MSDETFVGDIGTAAGNITGRDAGDFEFSTVKFGVFGKIGVSVRQSDRTVFPRFFHQLLRFGLQPKGILQAVADIFKVNEKCDFAIFRHAIFYNPRLTKGEHASLLER